MVLFNRVVALSIFSWVLRLMSSVNRLLYVELRRFVGGAVVRTARWVHRDAVFTFLFQKVLDWSRRSRFPSACD